MSLNKIYALPNSGFWPNSDESGVVNVTLGFPGSTPATTYAARYNISVNGKVTLMLNQGQFILSGIQQGFVNLAISGINASKVIPTQTVSQDISVYADGYNACTIRILQNDPNFRLYKNNFTAWPANLNVIYNGSIITYQL